MEAWLNITKTTSTVYSRMFFDIIFFLRNIKDYNFRGHGRLRCYPIEYCDNYGLFLYKKKFLGILVSY